MYEDKGAIFIVGAPRSGTTWLLRLLNKHSQIEMASEKALGYPGVREESDFFNYKIKSVNFTSDIKKRNWVRKRYYSILDKGTKYFIDKTPSHSLYIEEILDCFPEAKIIHVIRNGLNVTASLKEWRYFSEMGYQPAGDTPRPYDFQWRKEKEFKKFSLHKKDIRTWRVYTKAALQAADLTNNYYEIRYEDMQADDIGSVKKLLNFLDLDDETDIMFRNYNPDAPSHLGIHSNFKISAEPSRWINILNDRERNVFIVESHGLMKQLGYSVNIRDY